MGLVDLLLPASCAGCGRYGAVLCSVCRDGFIPASVARDRFFAPDPGVVVGDACSVALAAFRHDGITRRSLTRLKYGGAGRLAGPLAEAALPTLRILVRISGPVALVPVPVHPARERERGYNQAALLARGLGSRLHLPVREVLARRRETTKQHRLNRAARLRNLRGAFSLADGVTVPLRVIIVDDILTTSATLEACASTLTDAGASAVYGFAVAREV